MPNMLKILIILSAFAGFAKASWASEPEFTTSCELREGRAYGSVRNEGDAFEIDGYVLFSFYAEDGALLGDADEYEYEFVAAGSTEEIDFTAAPAAAFTCAFNVDGALASGGGEPPSYATSCDLRDGYAYGGVHNYGAAFEIDGFVWFFFLDRNGRVIGDEDSREAEMVPPRSFQAITSLRAPRDAAACAFEIAGAIRR